MVYTHDRAIRDVTCRMESHTVICYPTHVNAPRLNPSLQAGNRFTYPGGMKGWIDLGYPAMHRPRVELATSQSQVRRPNHYSTEPHSRRRGQRIVNGPLYYRQWHNYNNHFPIHSENVSLWRGEQVRISSMPLRFIATINLPHSPCKIPQLLIGNLPFNSLYSIQRIRGFFITRCVI